MVRVSNAYGVITSTAPATLTVLAPGPATNFTLNYGGAAVVEGIGADWNTVNVWNPGGLPAVTSAYGNPGSSYELVAGSLLRNPTTTTYNVFPGTNLVIDGDGNWVTINSGSIVNVGGIRFKNAAGNTTTNYFPNLVLNGGELNIGEPPVTTGVASDDTAAGHSKKNPGHNLRTARQRFERIKAMHAEYSIDQLCATLAVTRSGYHAWASREPGVRAQAHAALLPLITQAHRESRQTYGSPQL